MQIIGNIGGNAVAIAQGIGSRDYALCEFGVAEQYDIVGDAAKFITEHEVAIAGLMTELDFPGVFAYEVSEDFGQWWRDTTDESNPLFFNKQERDQVGQLLAAFFLGQQRPTLSSDEERADYDQILAYLGKHFPDIDLSKYARSQPAEAAGTTLDLGPVTFPWKVGDTVYIVTGAAVTKAEVRSLLATARADANGQQAYGRTLTGHIAGKGDVVVPSKELDRVFTTAEAAFASIASKGSGHRFFAAEACLARLPKE